MKNKSLFKFFFWGGGGDKVRYGKCGSGVFHHWAVPQAAHAVIGDLCMYTTQTLSFFVDENLCPAWV